MASTLPAPNSLLHRHHLGLERDQHVALVALQEHAVASRPPRASTGTFL
jgi:hypothetical protein